MKQNASKFFVKVTAFSYAVSRLCFALVRPNFIEAFS